MTKEKPATEQWVPMVKAAKALGVSFPTFKIWIQARHIEVRRHELDKRLRLVDLVKIRELLIQ